MGIPIEFVNGKEPKKDECGAIASIKYSAVDGSDADEGALIYIKPTLGGSESIDIKQYSSEIQISRMRGLPINSLAKHSSEDIGHLGLFYDEIFLSSIDS